VDIYTKKLAPFVASPQRIVDRMLEIASIKPNETVFDLGCGDGRILFQAAQKYQAKGVGIEIDEKLVQSTSSRVVEMGLQNRVRIQQGNLMDADLSSADVVTIYLLTQSNELLRPRLEKMLRPGTRVVSYDYVVPGWKPKRIDRTAETANGGHLIYLYEMPPEKQ
jgi:SAM-dependent methyltransferase